MGASRCHLEVVSQAVSTVDIELLHCCTHRHTQSPLALRLCTIDVLRTRGTYYYTSARMLPPEGLVKVLLRQ